jgi:UDP-glucose 4-epimerase
VSWTTASHWLERRVLVTGASGFLGRAVCGLLQEAGAHVVGTWRSRPLPHGLDGFPATFPADADALLAQVRPEVVFHLAAPVKPGAVGEDTRLRVGILDATVAVARASRAHGAFMVQVGTCAEYGDVPAPYREDGPISPTGPYGALKAAASLWVLAQTRSTDLAATVVRPFRAYGPHDRSSVVAQAARAALAGQTFGITDGAQRREWNCVDSIAAGVVSAAVHPEAKGRVVNLGGGPELSVHELVDRVFVLAGADADLVKRGVLPRRAGEVDRLVGDHSLARSFWGDLAGPDLESGLEGVLDWWRMLPREAG